jgi:hypothetical protein
MFGGKVMGVSPENISKISGQTADDLFNCAGSNTKFFHVVRTRGRRTGKFNISGNGIRARTKSTGYDLYRKPLDIYAWNINLGSYVILTTVKDNLTYTWNTFNCFVDVFTTVSSDRTKSYYVSDTSYQPSAYFEGVVNSYLP